MTCISNFDVWMIHSAIAIHYSNPDQNFAKGLSLIEDQINITICRVFGICARRHFHIKIEQGFTTTDSFSPQINPKQQRNILIINLILPHLSLSFCGHGFCLCKFNSCHSVQFSLLTVATWHFLSPFSQECCFLKTPAKEWYTFQWVSSLGTLWTCISKQFVQVEDEISKKSLLCKVWKLPSLNHILSNSSQNGPVTSLQPQTDHHTYNVMNPQAHHPDW